MPFDSLGNYIPPELFGLSLCMEKEMPLLMEDDITKKKLSSEAWYEPKTDTINVKVRIACKTTEGKTIKKGCVFTISEEMLDWIAEGQEYIRKPIPNDRFTRIITEDE